MEHVCNPLCFLSNTSFLPQNIKNTRLKIVVLFIKPDFPFTILKVFRFYLVSIVVDFFKVMLFRKLRAFYSTLHYTFIVR